eukprot:scaffold4406_cov112-Isochrysis_galbana.AAC.6
MATAGNWRTCGRYLLADYRRPYWGAGEAPREKAEIRPDAIAHQTRSTAGGRRASRSRRFPPPWRASRPQRVLARRVRVHCAVAGGRRGSSRAPSSAAPRRRASAPGAQSRRRGLLGTKPSPRAACW